MDALQTPAAAQAATIIDETLAFIAKEGSSDDEFNRQALRLYAHQYQWNLPFQRFCRQRGKTLRNVRNWREIPAVPINAFKELTLACQPPSADERVFMTSGTTRGHLKGRHHHPSLAVYDLSMERNFAQRVLRLPGRIRMGILFPTEVLLPNSSLAHYLALALRAFGSADSDYFLGPDGLDAARLVAALGQAEQSGEPYALLGASDAFLPLIDRLRQSGRAFALPAGSWVLDTGGFKGHTRQLPLSDFYAQLSAALGIEPSRCINMYGMTELSTQFYDDGNQTQPAVKSGPHWIRSMLVEPLGGNEVAHGERGLLVHCDLANFNSVSTILTEDVGIAAAAGFVLAGRAEGAAAKGCALAVDEFLRAARA